MFSLAFFGGLQLVFLSTVYGFPKHILFRNVAVKSHQHMSPRLAELLDEMIFSADIEGFIKRKSKELVNDEFLDFLRQKLSASDDDDEKVIITDTIALITERQRLQDGLGDQVNIVFETRLDQILFKSPNMRLKWIEENAEDITPGFVEFVQNELRKNTDIDNKVDFTFCCCIIINMN